MKRKGTGKRILTLALAAALAGSNLSLPQSTAWAVEAEQAEQGKVIYATSYEWIDLGGIETSADMGFTPFLAMERAAGAEKWIDRVDNLPVYAKNLYDALEAGVDGVGEDVLIDDKSFSKDTALTFKSSNQPDLIINAIKFYETNTEIDSDEVNKNVSIAYGAFDRDHPEVFWLDGKQTSMVAVPALDGKISYYFICKSHGSNNSFDIRAAEYQSETKIKSAITERDTKINTIIQSLPAGAANDEKLRSFNEWLTKNNCYNSDLEAAKTNYPAAWECISALKGSTGTQGPVCEGYARAFKVLCDKVGIPCVLVDGKAKDKPASAGEDHMWNYVQLDGAWYAVDVTWNDPVEEGSTSTDAVSTHESEDWFLVGANTQIKNMSFLDSHPVSNQPSLSVGTAFVHGPELSETAYVKKEKPVITFTSTKSSLVYDGSPVTAGEFSSVSVTVEDQPVSNPALTYYYKSAADTEYTKGLPTNAGTYQIKVSVAAGENYSSAECATPLTLTIDKKPITITYPTAAAITYGTKLKDCTLTGGSKEGTFSWEKPEEILPAGTHNPNVIFTLNDKNNYEIQGSGEKGTVAVTVAQAAPVVTVQAVNDGLEITVNVTVEGKPDAKAPAGTVELYVDGTAQGTKNLDTSGKAVISYTAPSRTEYKIKVSYHAEGNSNYTDADSINVTVDTKKKAQTGFAIKDTGKKIYGDAPFQLEITGGNGTGKVSFSSSDPEVVSAVTGGQVTIKKAGEAIITAVKASDNNFNEATATIKLVVGKRNLIFTAEDKTVKVGQQKPELTYKSSGLVNGDKITTEPTCSAATADMNRRGTYPITISGAEVEKDDCYTIIYQNGTLTVTSSSSSNRPSSSNGNSYRPSSSSTSTATSQVSTKKETGIVEDVKKGKVDPVKGIVTGTTNGKAGDGYSHWKSDDKGWWLQYADGTYAAGSIAARADGSTFENVAWEMINGEWFCFGADGYAKSGWVLDEALGGWFYIDINIGMRTGWLFVGKWYYLNPVSDGCKGKMTADTWTPDGYYVGTDGAWVQGKTK